MNDQPGSLGQILNLHAPQPSQRNRALKDMVYYKQTSDALSSGGGGEKGGSSSRHPHTTRFDPTSTAQV